MAKAGRSATAPQVRHCRKCHQDFAVYRSDGLVVQCPRCGQAATMPLHRRWLRLVAVVILAAVALAVAAAVILNR